MAIKLHSASNFSMKELTDLYNETRLDYLVPMPMNAERLQNYIKTFDIDLERSCIASTSSDEILGLGMLGVREKLTWITRMGILPGSRRSGVGEAILDYLLMNTDALGKEETHLEIISNNAPAHKLFQKKGFVDEGLYLVLRRTPQSISEPIIGDVQWLEKDEALKKLKTFPEHLTWITAIESMQNSPDTQGIRIQMPNGDTGWLIFRLNKIIASHLIIYTENGDAIEVGIQLLKNLCSRYPNIDVYAENIHVKNPYLPAFQALSFNEIFSRIEMRRQMIIKIKY